MHAILVVFFMHNDCLSYRLDVCESLHYIKETLSKIELVQVLAGHLLQFLAVIQLHAAAPRACQGNCTVRAADPGQQIPIPQRPGCRSGRPSPAHPAPTLPSGVTRLIFIKSYNIQGDEQLCSGIGLPRKFESRWAMRISIEPMSKM